MSIAGRPLYVYGPGAFGPLFDKAEYGLAPI